MANIDSSPEIQRAIKSLMGLEVVERASRHIGSYVLPMFKKDLKQHSSHELSEIIEKENHIEEKISDLIQEKKDVDNNHRHFQTIRSEINRKLKEIGEASGLQRRREAAEQEIEELQLRMQELAKERLQFLSKNGFLAFTENLLKKTSAIFEDKRKKSELPSKIKTQFIDDLLISELCICGRPLEEG
ncbi:MAG: hypothetical protein IPP22_09100 [Nitrosomonas sp.]|nr:hypothetical protein [Nitrosomonas sp.]